MIRKLMILCIALGLLTTACNASTPAVTPAPEATATAAPTPEPTIPAPPEMLTFTDDLGHTLEFSAYPQSIVSISPSTTEILFAIGAGGQLVGRDDASIFPAEALNVTNVGALWQGLPTEAILALQPDLVVAAQIISEDQVTALRDLGLNVYWQANPATYEELWDNLRELAQLTGHDAEAETLIAGLQARVSAVQAKIAGAAERPSVFYELDATDPANPWTTGSGTFIDYIITQAGGANAAAELQGEFTQISAEQLIALDPQIILLADAPYGVTAESVAARPGWEVIAAVKNAAIFPVDPNTLSVPGPRLVDGLEAVAALLHPELFEK